MPLAGSYAGAAALALPALLITCVSTSLACGGASSVPDVREATRTYAQAAARGDSRALYAMLSDASKRSRTARDVEQVVHSEGAELAEQGRDLQQGEPKIEATARLRFADGEEAALDLRDGRYWVTASGALPGGARTPEEALEQLRRVLARRSYAGLMRVLSPATRASIENDLRSMVDGLDRPGSLPVVVTGDVAVVAVPGGHQVKLRRESGLWRVDDFD